MSHYVEVNGVRATTAIVYVPSRGMWWAEVTFDDTAEVTETRSGCILTIAQTTFRGTLLPEHSGTFGLRRSCGIVAGAAGWRRKLPVTALHNDAGVNLSTVIQGLAKETGETIANLTDRKLGPKYSRLPTTAAAHMNALLPAWHVDYAGVTQCRAPQGGTLGEHQILEYDPLHRYALLATMNPGNIPLGVTLPAGERLDAPLIVRSLEIRVENDEARVRVWGA